MLYAEMKNKILKIDEKEAESYRQSGFDIVEIDAKGTRKVKSHGVGKSVPYEKYEALEKELAELKKEQAKKSTTPEENK